MALDGEKCAQYLPLEITGIQSMSGGERIWLGKNGRPEIITTSCTLMMDGGPIELPFCKRGDGKIMEVDEEVKNGFCQIGGRECPLKTVIDATIGETRTRLLTQE